MRLTCYRHPNTVDIFSVEEINIRPVVGEVITCKGVPYRVIKEAWFACDIGPIAAVVPMNYGGEIPIPDDGELSRVRERKEFIGHGGGEELINYEHRKNSSATKNGISGKTYRYLLRK
jgi:hypothetical protein